MTRWARARAAVGRTMPAPSYVVAWAIVCGGAVIIMAGLELAVGWEPDGLWGLLLLIGLLSVAEWLLVQRLAAYLEREARPPADR